VFFYINSEHVWSARTWRISRYLKDESLTKNLLRLSSVHHINVVDVTEVHSTSHLILNHPKRCRWSHTSSSTTASPLVQPYWRSLHLPFGSSHPAASQAPGLAHPLKWGQCVFTICCKAVQWSTGECSRSHNDSASIECRWKPAAEICWAARFASALSERVLSSVCKSPCS